MRKGCLGCAFPVMVGLIVVFLALFIIGFIAGPIGKNMVGDLGLPEWLSVAQPEPELPAEAVFHFGPFNITNTVIAAWLSMVVLIILSIAAMRKMRLIPTRLQSFFESALGWVYDLCKEVAGEKNGRRFFPVVVTIFLFVITNAWLGLLPGFGSIILHTAEGHEVHLFRAANTDINMPLALALVSFVIVGYYGIKQHKLRFISEYIRVNALRRGPMGIIDMFVGILELLSVFVRIVSFTFRLFGNMTAGEILLLIVMFLVPYLAALPFYGLELLVGFVQALIFGGLTLVFLTLAVASHDEEAH